MSVSLRFNTLSALNPCRNVSGTVTRVRLFCSRRVEASEHCIMESGSLVISLFIKETLLRESEFENSPTEISLKPIP